MLLVTCCRFRTLPSSTQAQFHVVNMVEEWFPPVLSSAVTTRDCTCALGETLVLHQQSAHHQVYANAESYKVASMMEFIGVLSVDPALAHFEEEGEGQLGDPLQVETAAERKAHSPPPSLIPRLHCIVARCLSHSNPLLPSNLTTPIKRTGNTDSGGLGI